MVWHCVRIALLAGAFAALSVPAQAGHCCAPAPSCCAPAYRTEYRTENYTAYRFECYPEVRERVCTYYEHVPSTEWVTRKFCVCVPYTADKVVMQTHVTCKPVTHVVRRCVDKGHYECRQVPCAEKRSCFKGLFRKCRKSCDPCCDPCEPCCVPMKTVRVWVPCPVWEECPVTTYQRVCESRPINIKVTCYKHEWREEKCQVTTCKCIAKQRVEKYTVMCSRKVAVPCTRTVCVRVPCEAPACAPACAPSCCEPCCQPCCHTRKCGFRSCGRSRSHGCRSSGCGSSFHAGHSGCCN